MMIQMKHVDVEHEDGDHHLKDDFGYHDHRPDPWRHFTIVGLAFSLMEG